MPDPFEPLTPEQRAALVDALLSVEAAWATARTDDPAMLTLIAATREVLVDASLQLRHDGLRPIES